MISTTLTKRQEQILNFLQQHHARTGLIPTVREIQHAFGFASSNAIDSHLRALERKQYIRRGDGRARAIAIRWGPYEQSESTTPATVQDPVEQMLLGGTGEYTCPRLVNGHGALPVEHIKLDERTTLVPGDAITVMGLMAPDSVDAIVTDPPYGLIEYEPDNHEKLRQGRGGVWRIPPKLNGVERAPLPRFTVLTVRDRERLASFFEVFGHHVCRILKPGGHLILASNPLLSTTVFTALSASGLEKRGEVIRMVTTLRGGDRPKGAETEFPEISVMPRSCWEPWGLFRKELGEATVAANLRKYGTGGFRRPSLEDPFKDFVICPPARGREREIAPHPSLKPQRLMRYLVRAALPLGRGIVLDPFAGSGSTLAAASAIGYRSIGIERDVDYVRLAQRAFADLKSLDVPAE